MRLSYQDRAIEYNAIMVRVGNKIKVLKEIKIDVSSEEREYKSIIERCDRETRAYVSTYSSGCASQDISSVEEIYDKSIGELDELEEQLKRHDIYMDAYGQAIDLENKAKRIDFATSTQETDYSAAIIRLLEMINSSDTRPFHAEENVVKKVYDVAYEIIKMEILQFGKSKTLSWVKEDELTSSIIANLVEKELEEVKDSNQIDLLKGVFDDISSFTVSPNRLNEELILFLALQNGTTRRRVEVALAKIVQELMEKKDFLDKTVGDSAEIRDRLHELREKIKGSHIYNRIAIMIGLVGILIAGKHFIDNTTAKIGHFEYKTTPGYYTNQEGKTPPNFPEYMEKIPGFESLTFTAYSPWQRKEVFYGDYQRKILTYDLSGKNIGELSEVLDFDFEKLKHGTKTETREELDPSELYTDAIIEILRLEQDENNSKFVPHEEEQATFNSIASTILCILVSFGEGLTILSLILKLKRKFSDRKAFAKNSAELVDLLENYRLLCERNEVFRARFTEMYTRVSAYCKSDQISKAHDDIKKIQLTPVESLQFNDKD